MSEQNETALAMVDPGVFDTVDDAGEPSAGSRTPWVGFFGGKVKKGRDALVAAGVEVDQFYLFDSEPLKLKPFELHLLKHKRYYTKQNGAGKTTNVRLVGDPNSYAAGYRELQLSLVAVLMRTPTGNVNLVPAILSVRSGLVKALELAINTAKGSAKDPDVWAARSTQHAIAAKAVWPGGRFVTTIWGSHKTLDDGNDFNIGHSSIRPAKPEEVLAFNKLAQGQDYLDKLDPAFKTWAKRCESLEQLPE